MTLPKADSPSATDSFHPACPPSTPVVVVDYGIGNLSSVERALRHVGGRVVRSNDPSEIRNAPRLVLPGVGAFGACVERLRHSRLEGPLRHAIKAGVPLLGICVGMQMLFDKSEESPGIAGLGLLRGTVRRFVGNLKIPHVGWNELLPRRQHPLTDRLEPGSCVYFAHSYYCLADPADVIADCRYGVDFSAAVARENVSGVQFHPEKSGATGLRILARFLGQPS